MDDFIGILITVLHFFIVYFLTLTIVLSNNLKILLVALVVLCVIIFQHYIFGRCVVTPFEYGGNLPTAPELVAYSLSEKYLDEIIVEKLITNVAMLIVLNKIAVLFILEYYKNNSYISYIKNLIKI